MNAREFAKALGGEAVGTDRALCPGPGHSVRDRSLSVLLDPGAPEGFVVHSFAGDDMRACRDHVRTAIGLGTNTHLRAPRLRRLRRPPAEPARPDPRALAIWRESRDAVGSPVETYLTSRGLTDPIPPSIRFHPALRHPDKREVLPAMVCAVQNAEGRITGIHRTFLRADGSGKAAVKKPRLMLGPCGGGAVRLAAAGRRLGVSEGIETGLSVRQSCPDLPVWAAMCASGMTTAVIPAHVREVVILADADDAGEQAAQALARRPSLGGREVKIARPPAGFNDFNDALIVSPASKAAAHG